MVYCFDLDGTLCYWVVSKKCPRGRAEDAQPIKARIEIVNKLYDEGHTIYIDTARGTMTGKDHYDTTAKQLEKWGLKYHTLRTGVKFHGDFYIDDRGMSDIDFFSKK